MLTEASQHFTYSRLISLCTCVCVLSEPHKLKVISRYDSFDIVYTVDIIIADNYVGLTLFL